jgi:hypothetical protein
LLVRPAARFGQGEDRYELLDLDALALGVDRIQRNLILSAQQVETWRSSQITDDHAKLVIYGAVCRRAFGFLLIARDVPQEHKN